MSQGVRPENPQISSQAKKANTEVGYGANNPEPIAYHLRDDDDALDVAAKQDYSPNALHAAEEYIYGKKNPR